MGSVNGSGLERFGAPLKPSKPSSGPAALWFLRKALVFGIPILALEEKEVHLWLFFVNNFVLSDP